MTSPCAQADVPGQPKAALCYWLTTAPFPLQANATSDTPVTAQLELTAANLGAEPVTLWGIVVQLPAGDARADLAAGGANLQPVPPSGWILAEKALPTGSAQFTFRPSTGPVALNSGKSLDFVFNQVEANQAPGTAPLTITELSVDPCFQGMTCPQANLEVTKWPPGWGEVRVTTLPDPPSLAFGQPFTLRWAGPAGATYSIDYETREGAVHVPADGAPGLPNAGTYPASGAPQLILARSTTLFLRVAAEIDGEAYAASMPVTATVLPPEPQIERFEITADPVESGRRVSFTLSWSLKNVSRFQIVASDGDGGQERVLEIAQGATTHRVFPRQLDTVYTLMVDGVDLA